MKNILFSEHNPKYSHYGRENAPRKRFIQDDSLTVKKLYENFIQQHPGFCHISRFRKEFQDMNVGIGRPPVDQCADCITLSGQSLKNHQNEAKVAREEYRKDKSQVWSVGLVKQAQASPVRRWNPGPSRHPSRKDSEATEQQDNLFKCHLQESTNCYTCFWCFWAVSGFHFDWEWSFCF